MIVKTASSLDRESRAAVVIIICHRSLFSHESWSSIVPIFRHELFLSGVLFESVRFLNLLARQKIKIEWVDLVGNLTRIWSYGCRVNLVRSSYLNLNLNLMRNVLIYITLQLSYFTALLGIISLAAKDTITLCVAADRQQHLHKRGHHSDVLIHISGPVTWQRLFVKG